MSKGPAWSCNFLISEKLQSHTGTHTAGNAGSAGFKTWKSGTDLHVIVVHSDTNTK